VCCVQPADKISISLFCNAPLSSVDIFSVSSLDVPLPLSVISCCRSWRTFTFNTFNERINNECIIFSNYGQFSTCRPLGFLFSATVVAQNTYTVGGAGANFPTLEALRTSGVLQDGDTVVLNRNDISLTAPFTNTLTLQGAGLTSTSLEEQTGFLIIQRGEMLSAQAVLAERFMAMSTFPGDITRFPTTD